MPCACSLPACTSTSHSQTSRVSVFICASGATKDAPLPRGLCAWRAFVLAVICVMFVSQLLFVCAEGEAGFESSPPYHGAERFSSKELSTEALLLRDYTEQKSSAERIFKFRNRKFLRQGTGSADDSTKELFAEALADFPPEGISQLSSGNDQFPGRGANPYRRMLIPATNECTNKDISITQRRDGSPGMPRFSVQIVNTCVSDCAPADIHVFCGWFASSPPPNPNTFQRLSYNDCLVNGGRPLGHGAIIQFQYANSFMYPIRFRSARFCR
ncbi:hypothetical protein M758_10G003800 [Ceratodon purpureus]|nr:hypothetical protein M758_10G003800 [Ceratodon purpureus]